MKIMSETVIGNVPEPEEPNKLSRFLAHLANYSILFVIIFEGLGPLIGRVLIYVGVPVGSWLIATTPSLDFVFEWAFQHLGLFLMPAIVVGACGLFSLRGYWPTPYGLLEILVGLWAVNRVNLLVLSTETAFGVLGGVYIMIRGLDNVAKGLEAEGRLKTLFSVLFNNPKREKGA